MRTTTKIAKLLVLVVLLGQTTCTKRTRVITLDSEASDNAEVERLFRKGRTEFRKEKLDVADETFATIIRDFPDDPLVRSAWIYRARISLAGDNPERARAYLKNVGEPKDALFERAILYDGVALQRMGRHKEALERVTPLVGTLTDDAETVTLMKTMWQAAEALGDTHQTVQALDKLITHMPRGREKRETIKHLEGIIAKIENIEALQALAGKLPEDQQAWALIMTRIASIHLEAGRFKESAEILEAVEKETKTALDLDAAEVSDMSDVDMNNIGLLVPLSGRTRLVGETVLKGVKLAANELKLTVTIRDSGGDPDRAVEGVIALVEKEKVAAIIGPLDAKAAEAAAAKAEELGVPLLALTVNEGVSDLGEHIFRPFASSRLEIEALVDKARQEGCARFGILYPDNGYGKTMRSLFEGELQRRELELATEASYPADAKSFSKKAEALLKTQIDALLLPDNASRIALIAPALAAAKVNTSRKRDSDKGEGTTMLLIPSIGYADDLLRRAGRYLTNAVFSRYYAPDVSQAARDFTERYRLEYGGDPNYLSAFGYDAVVILRSAISPDAKDRADIRRGLLESAEKPSKAKETVTGLKGFTKGGAPLMKLWLYRIENETFVPIP